MFVSAVGNAAAQSAPRSTSPEPVSYKDFAVRTNLLYDALVVPTLGFEWRMSDSWGLKLDGSWSYWCARFGKVHDVWLVNPEIRRYLGQDKRFYLGLGAGAGGYNIYRLGAVGSMFPDRTGYQGTVYNGGLVAGYQMRLSHSFSLDFNLGVGYNHLKYDSFTMVSYELCAYREYKEKNATKNWFGPTQAGVSLVWNFTKSK
ncbi:MAG: DUF3575 domain-containing protein [Bacteroidales bacterium]|nr:DUF3575 domain-containing protein [Bacteroidales bacterium]